MSDSSNQTNQEKPLWQRRLEVFSWRFFMVILGLGGIGSVLMGLKAPSDFITILLALVGIPLIVGFMIKYIYKGVMSVK